MAEEPTQSSEHDNERTDSGTVSTQRVGARFGPSMYRPVLLGISGPGSGLRIPITRQSTILGRSGSADFRISDSGSSRHHARVIYENHDRPNEMPRCFVEDMESRNGTEVNGRRISALTRLAERDRITIGRTVLGYFLRDDAELRHDESLYESATRDQLTGLDNRRQLLALLRSHLARAHRTGAPLSFLLLDADHFKKVNDTYGHDIGDEALKFLARILRSCCRESDLVGRWGGEEFGVALPDTPLADAITLAERIRRTTAGSDLVLGTRILRMTVSIGGADFREGDTVDTLFRRADEQLYRSKENGRNCVSFAGVD